MLLIEVKDGLGQENRCLQGPVLAVTPGKAWLWESEKYHEEVEVDGPLILSESRQVASQHKVPDKNPAVQRVRLPHFRFYRFSGSTRPLS